MEWLLSPEDLLKAAPELAKPAHKDMQVLVLGCGSSMLPTNLANAGWSRVHCIDASSALISTCATEADTASQTPASATTSPTRSHRLSQHTLPAPVSCHTEH